MHVTTARAEQGHALTEEQRLELFHIQKLIVRARNYLGLVITVETVPCHPQAMGNYDLHISARNERNR